MHRYFNKSFLFTTAAGILPVIAFAADNNPGKTNSLNAALIGLVTLVIILFFAILILGNTLRQLGFVYRDKMRERKNNAAPASKLLLFVLGFTFYTNAVMAQAAETAAVALPATDYMGVNKPDFYLLMSIIAVELLVIISFTFLIRTFVRLISINPELEVVAKKIVKVSFWDRFNKVVPIEKEQDILLDHDYDGIKELDNSLPPWWKYGFYLTIVTGFVYIWYYHAGGSGPSSYDEYVAEVKKGEEDKALYLANSANLVDENNVKMLDEAGNAAGQVTFEMMCAACHAKDGGGGVGPNLTDEYWLHGGSIQDVFKSIKYGWPDKGMKSWKDDFSPKQIAELSSYIKTLKGAKTLAPKDKQGELYIESEQSADTTKSVAAN